MTINEKLKNYMKRHDVRQVAVAQHVGLSKIAFNLCLNGRTKMSADVFIAACEYMNVSPEEVLGGGSVNAQSAAFTRQATHIGERLKVYMKRHHIEQKNVAEHIGVIRTGLNQALNGKTKLYAETFIAACEYMQVSPSKVLEEVIV